MQNQGTVELMCLDQTYDWVNRLTKCRGYFKFLALQLRIQSNPFYDHCSNELYLLHTTDSMISCLYSHTGDIYWANLCYSVTYMLFCNIEWACTLKNVLYSLIFDDISFRLGEQLIPFFTSEKVLTLVYIVDNVLVWTIEVTMNIANIIILWAST